MDCITRTEASHTPLIAAVPLAPPRVKLRGILHEHGETFAIFSAPPSQFCMPVVPDHLASFEAFAKQAATLYSIQVRHPARSWRSSVERAQARSEGRR